MAGTNNNMPQQNNGEEIAPVAAPSARVKWNQKEDDSIILENLIRSNQALASRNSCISINSKRKLGCNCLAVMKDRPEYCEAVAEYQLRFRKLTSDEQKEKVIEWMRHSSGSQKLRFRIPYILGENSNPEEFAQLKADTICLNAMMDLLNRKRAWYSDCRQHFEKNTLPGHKLVGKMSNRKRAFLTSCEEDLVAHFDELLQEAEPIATRYVREVTGETSLRDTEDDVKYLPSFLSVRGCYAKFCFEKRGTKITTDSKGKITKTPFDVDNAKSVPAWSTYQSFWNERYPKLKVRKPTEDICSYCFKFYNRHKFNQYGASSSADSRGGETGTEELFFSAEEEEEAAGSIDNTSTTVNGPVTASPAVLQQEKDILDATEHVKKAQVMRQLVNEKIRIAREDRQQSTIHGNRTYTFVADYCQNMSLPHFGKEQPGDTYYYTPTNLYGFGVADVSFIADDGNEADHLYFHAYKEGYGAKGGNNVASLIMKTLKKLDLLKDQSAKELNIVMDNCPGQNKNNHVILLAPYLVEMGYFRSVNMLFLVVGHTKNVCDRRFNNLKHIYHRSQVFTLDGAVDVLNQSKFVTVWKVDVVNDWKDWLAFLLKAYYKLDKMKLKITDNHIFTARYVDTIDEDDGRVLASKLQFSTRISNMEQHLYKHAPSVINKDFASESNRYNLLKSMYPQSLQYKGLSTFKQVMMNKNYLPFVPPEYHSDELYKKPSKEALAAEAADQKKRKAYKKQKKEEAQASTESNRSTAAPTAPLQAPAELPRHS